MNAFVVTVLAFALVVGSVIGTARALSLRSQPVVAAQPCIGLACWPSDPPVRHRPAQHANLQPVW